MKFTKKQFDERFPTSDACLEEIKQRRFSNWTCPKCSAKDLLSKVSGRTAYQCVCGNQVYPLVGTIFEKSSTDLRTWFFAMFLMTQTRAGNSAKTLERMTGVTYKTAWRMFTLIRTAMVENEATATSLMPHVQANVSRGAYVITDQHPGYRVLKRLGYPHSSINHQEHYALGEIHTNTIEGFWSILKNGITTVYRHVDKRYLPLYAAEYAWRYSNRKSVVPMFDILLRRVA